MKKGGRLRSEEGKGATQVLEDLEGEPKEGNIVEFGDPCCQWTCVELISEGETTTGKVEGLVLRSPRIGQECMTATGFYLPKPYL